MANTYKALSTVTVGAGGSSSIAFSNIPQTYTDLVLQISLRSNRATEVYDTGYIRFNSDSGANYSKSMRLYGNGASAVSDNPNLTSAGLFEMPTASGATASTFGNISIYIPNYVSNTNYKSYSNDGVSENNGTTSYQSLIAGVWNNTSPITSITLTPFAGSQFVQYSTATLYGVFNADVSTAPATPTIGTATGADSSASITFTPVSNAASYTMTSTPSSITATGASSPITVTGLTNGTAYTFKVKSNNPFGSSAESAASNSVTPAAVPVFDSIASITTTGASSITFSSIPSTYKHLQIRWSGTTGSGDAAYLRINGNTSSVYAYNDFYFNTGGFAGFSAVATLELGQVRGSTGILDIFDVQASKIKTVKMWNGDFGSLLMMNAGVLAGVADPISSLTLWSLSTVGITYSLYGVK